MTLQKNNGQGVIEALVSLPVIVLAITAISVLLYRATVFYYVDYHLHEALVCSNHTRLGSCESQLNDSLKKILWFGTAQRASLTKKYNGTRGTVVIEFTPELSMTQEITFPLRSRQKW